MQNTKKLVIVLLAYAILVSLAYFFKLGGDAYFPTVTMAITYVTPLIPVCVGVYALRYFGIGNSQGKAILCITMMAFLFGVADIVWNIIGSPTISFCDILWFAGYLLFYAGMVFAFKTINPGFFSDYRRLALLTVGLLVISVVYFIFFPLAWDSEVSTLENLVTSGYSFADLIITLFIVVLVSMVLSGSYSKPWMVFGLGAILRWVSDIFYSLNAETFTEGTLVDLGWSFSYIFYAISFLLLLYNAQKTLQGFTSIERKRRVKRQSS